MSRHACPEKSALKILRPWSAVGLPPYKGNPRESAGCIPRRRVVRSWRCRFNVWLLLIPTTRACLRTTSGRFASVVLGDVVSPRTSCTMRNRLEGIAIEPRGDAVHRQWKTRNLYPTIIRVYVRLCGHGNGDLTLRRKYSLPDAPSERSLATCFVEKPASSSAEPRCTTHSRSSIIVIMVGISGCFQAVFPRNEQMTTPGDWDNFP